MFSKVMQGQPNTYAAWLAEFTRLAREQDAEWLIPADASLPLPGFATGATPQEELTALKEMAEWRGCGCGGGG